MATYKGLLPDLNEIILLKDDGGMLEGTTSNLFFLRGQSPETMTLHTAPLTSVLPGTILKGILQSCRANVTAEKAPAAACVQVMATTPPRRQDLDLYGAAAVTSTSRLCLPVRHVYALAHGSGVQPVTAADVRRIKTFPLPRVDGTQGQAQGKEPLAAKTLGTIVRALRSTLLRDASSIESILRH